MTSNFSLPSELCEAVTRSPFRVQIAFDGNWMDAFRFGPDELPSRDDLHKVLAGREADVAVEFCFQLRSGENFFFGQRRLGKKGDRDTLEFVDRAFKCSLGRDWIDLPDFLSRLERAMPDIDRIAKDTLCKDLENVEIGITDWWRRGDVVEVWNKESPVIPDLKQITINLDDFPSLHRNDIKFACLEFNFLSPLHHWFAVEISDQVEGFHILRPSKAWSWLVKCLSNYKEPVD
ncbi:hypothetical protein NKG60_31730 [Mesorhizobium sp. M1428]|uniref:hypothetical protein n=1 Tax=Mesorhizobium sp. M1428 TaxID=2957102 RepID=UPI003337A351